MKRLLAVAALVMTFGAAAQNVVEARIEGQPLQYIQDGKLTGCGIRVIIANPAAPSGYDVLDASLNLDWRGQGYAKAMLERWSPDGTKRTRREVESFWFKAKGQPATTPIEKTFKGETPGSLLYVTDLVKAAHVLASQEPIQVAVQWKGRDGYLIFSGPIIMTKKDWEQSFNCTAELISNMQADVEQSATKN